MIKAVGDKIIVSILKIEKTVGGLFVPETAKDPQSYCKVLSVGENVKNVEVGNVIVCNPRAGMDMLINGKLFKCLAYAEVYGILTDTNIALQLGEVIVENKGVV